jgi:hypothetical protein
MMEILQKIIMENFPLCTDVIAMVISQGNTLHICGDAARKKPTVSYKNHIEV